MATISYDRKQSELVVGRTIFDYADELAVRVPSSCGRTGSCHECIVEIKSGSEALTPRTQAEKFLQENYRLACQAVVERADQDIRFSLLRRNPKILTTSRQKDLELDPAVRRWGDTVCYDGDEIDTYRGHIYGLAVDVGTTTVVAELVDLEAGQSVYVSSFENPQRFGGSDVMHRISYDAGEFRGELHKAIINALNYEIAEMCRRLGIARQQIYEVVAVGNSTMRDLFFGLDVQTIGQKPFKSVIEHEYLAGKRDGTSLTVPARSLRLHVSPKAKVFGAPLIGCHVGADVTADLVAIDVESQHQLVMLVDVGTNTEVVVGHAGRLIAASCPAGPAFEGGLITCGMPGYDGAIESIRVTDSRFEYRTIGGAEPKGICGSGLIDLLAELRRSGKMTPQGVFTHGSDEFTIVPETGITFSRRDASHLAQANAANYCGQFILMREYGVGPADINKLYLAGAFANYIAVGSALEIGFLAPVGEDRIIKVGNGAAQGAKEMLLSRRKRRSIERLVKSIEHIELETMPDFFDVFVEGCEFKPMPVHHQQ